ncbi:LRR receptor-like serine/threonine-protein kinase FLS2 [Senna tora]|uniref:LRR receptor-like serine/threonine-protein kinase FLS2 n=1 Tax=Senna tora TaxID=362788 RepID=A0A834WKS0_9FABA|nr:LRR receptor-like serine/threonine-protein kinase FLS2 [Senna tora]
MKMGWCGLVVVVLVAVIVIHVEVVVMGWLEDEKRALVDIKESLILQNASFPLLPSWDVSDPNSDICGWEGVQCHSSSAHIIALSLSNLLRNPDDMWFLNCPTRDSIMSKTLNMSLFLPFHQLTTLDLSRNCFQHALPIQDGRSNWTFPMLETLDLSHNYELDGKNVMKFLRGLTSLKNLNLAHCYIIIGRSLIQDGRSNWTFPMLETLDLSDNYELDGKNVMKFLRGLTSLKNLNLAGCNMIIGRSLIQEFSVFRNLEVLDLRYNSLSSPSSTFQDVRLLSNLTKLRTFDLSRTNVDKSIFKYLTALPALKSLFLSHTDQLGMNGTPINTDLCKMIELQELDLSHNGLTGTLDDACLGNLTSLRALDLSHNSLSGIIPPSLVAHLVYLEFLSLSYNNFGGSFSFNFLANNSKLKVLSLAPMNNAKTFRVETENPPDRIPSFQLEYLEMPSCQLNLSSRTIPTFLLYQHHLKYVDLSNNNLVGMFPYWLLVNNSRLASVFLGGNSLNELHLNQPFDQLVFLNLSNNKFQGNLPINIGYFLPRLEYLDVSSNMLDGHIPISIGEMSFLRGLDLSNNNFTGKIPKDILNRYYGEGYLKLSHNRLEGNIFPTPLMNLGYWFIFLANNNQFNGTLPKDGVLFSAGVVDISSNNLSGMLPSWIVKSPMMFSVSRNNFEGAIPIDFCKNDQLNILDLSHNRFSGTIPSCLFNSSLRLIDLGSNNLTGSIPEASSREYSFFGIIDLSNNQLSGSIPKSFYRLSRLAILSLANNKLEGHLSSEICELQQINILDLSHNKFTESIPSCFNNMSFGNYSPNSRISGYGISMIGYYYNSHFWFYGPENTYMLSFGEYEVQFVTKSITLSYKGDGLMSGLDLSSNQLTGEIPEQIGDLHNLHALNLSHNHLNGSIPEGFHNLKEIESLDLSSNNLIGEIPMQLQDLNFLSTFNVCYNNLSGRAPDHGQFGNFDESNYKGNRYLSWSNSNRRRNATPSETPLKNNSTEGSECVIDLIAFYWSFGASYVMVLLTLVTVLWINPRWRNVWFYYISICLQKSLGRFFDNTFFYQD